jgi:hypothetical protein
VGEEAAATAAAEESREHKRGAFSNGITLLPSKPRRLFPRDVSSRDRTRPREPLVRS